MCNLYKLSQAGAEVAQWFGAADRTMGANHAELIFPGYPGLVVAQGEVRVMNWGFPLAQVSKRTGKPIKLKAVTNTRDDRLHSAFWRDSFQHRRCLIPATAFAEAEGDYGNMTRTWLSVSGAEILAIAGIWRESEEWGPVYSMVTCAPCAQTAEIHDRMPVVLPPAAYFEWTHGTPEQAFALCSPFAAGLEIERTPVSWNAD